MSSIYPGVIEPRTLQRQVWDVGTAQSIPGVGRALGVIGGMLAMMAGEGLDLVRGIERLPRPRFLEQPDLEHVLPLFVRLQVEDYLLHGNACHLVTARDRDGWPAAVRWFPASAWSVQPGDGTRQYLLYGREVNRYDVVHVPNGADPLNPHRGMGVVERYLRTLDRIGLQEASERENLYGGSVPSVAVILPPDEDATDEELDDVADEWVDRFGGRERRPAFLPHGTTVTPLAWSPDDQQAADMRQLALTDTANIFNLDGWWLGAKASSHTYRSPGPMFLTLLRTTLEPILAPFESTWSQRWVPRGKRVTFPRQRALSDDLATTINALTKATGGPIMSTDEARTRIDLGPVPGGDQVRPPTTGQPADPADVDPDAGDTTEEGDPA